MNNDLTDEKLNKMYAFSPLLGEPASFEIRRLIDTIHALKSGNTKQKYKPTTNEIAEKLYTQYCRSVGFVAFNGNTLPTWEEFSKDESKSKQTNAWLDVAKLASCLAE